MTDAPPKVIDLFDALKRSLEKPATGTDMATAKPETTMPTREAPPAPKQTKREMDDGARIGRLVRTIQRIEKERDDELKDAPRSIHERAEKRMHKAVEGYPQHVVNAAMAAVEAMRPKAKPGE